MPLDVNPFNCTLSYLLCYVYKLSVTLNTFFLIVRCETKSLFICKVMPLDVNPFSCALFYLLCYVYKLTVALNTFFSCCAKRT